MFHKTKFDWNTTKCTVNCFAIIINLPFLWTQPIVVRLFQFNVSPHLHSPLHQYLAWAWVVLPKWHWLQAGAMCLPQLTPLEAERNHYIFPKRFLIQFKSHLYIYIYIYTKTSVNIPTSLHILLDTNRSFLFTSTYWEARMQTAIRNTMQWTPKQHDKIFHRLSQTFLRLILNFGLFIVGAASVFSIWTLGFSSSFETRSSSTSVFVFDISQFNWCLLITSFHYLSHVFFII